MSSLADHYRRDLVGFFSYSRSDDDHSDGALTQLRERIGKELRLQLGRKLRLWQDKEAIPFGTLWADEIRKAIAESAFFVPIISPSALNSGYCRMEFEAFLARERGLERDDLVFPILYVKVPALANAAQRGQDEVLKTIHVRQYADWTKIRLDDASSPEVGKHIARFCEDIVQALHKRWESPEERQRKEEAEETRRRSKEEAAELAVAERVQTSERIALERPLESPGWSTPRATNRIVAIAVVGLLALGIAGAALWFGDDIMSSIRSKPPVQTEAIAVPAGDLSCSRPMTASFASQCHAPLTAEQERGLKPKDTFRECENCPEMVVVQAGAFTMGSPEAEGVVTATKVRSAL
jgi:hypothetical protein